MNFKHLQSKYGTLIKIDLDRHKLTWYSLKGLKLLSKYYSIQHLILKRSPSKKWHIIVCLKEQMTDFEIIAWQFALDSDKHRERYNLLRVLNGNKMKDWNLLFPNKKHIKIKFNEPSGFGYSINPFSDDDIFDEVDKRENEKQLNEKLIKSIKLNKPLKLMFIGKPEQSMSSLTMKLYDIDKKKLKIKNPTKKQEKIYE